jgi:hypothetical protein
MADSDAKEESSQVQMTDASSGEAAPRTGGSGPGVDLGGKKPGEGGGKGQPRTPEELYARIQGEEANVRWRYDRHDVAASRWNSVAGWTKLIIAFSAGVSTISLFANSDVLATTFAIVTALIAALNAAFNPAEAANAHREAARAYGRLRRPLAQLGDEVGLEYVEEFTTDPTTGEQYDAGSYRNRLPADKGRLWSDFLDQQERIEAIEERAPAFSRLRRHRLEGEEFGWAEAPPRNWWEYWRLKRVLKWRNAGRRLMESSSSDGPDSYRE